MQLPNDLVSVGKITKTHGYQGLFKASLDTSEEVFSTGESLFIKINEKAVPFFITHLQYTGDESVIIGVAELTVKEETRQYLGHEILAPSSHLQHLEDALYLKRFIGYTLFDENAAKTLGQIQDVDLDGPQELLVVITENDEEVLVPWEEQLLQKEDEDRKVLSMVLPEGLKDL